MKYFQLIRKDIDVAPFFQELGLRGTWRQAGTPARQYGTAGHRQSPTSDEQHPASNGHEAEGMNGNDVHQRQRTRWAREFPRIYGWTAMPAPITIGAAPVTTGALSDAKKIESRILDGFKGKLVTPTPRQRQFASFALSGIV
jgi:hypothetical protein